MYLELHITSDKLDEICDDIETDDIDEIKREIHRIARDLRTEIEPEAKQGVRRYNKR